MKNMINDLISFLSTLNFVDIVFFTAVITLLILVVVLLYILKTSDDDKETSKLDLKLDNTNEIKDLDLVSLTKELESAKEEPKAINLTKYEEEQEKKAIISYDELINTQSIPIINYKEEHDMDGLTVKAIDINNLVDTMEPKPITHPTEYTVEKENKPVLISYEKEEDFLRTLKKLESMLD